MITGRIFLDIVTSPKRLQAKGTTVRVKKTLQNFRFDGIGESLGALSAAFMQPT
jgi:hypothetical protein